MTYKELKSNWIVMSTNVFIDIIDDFLMLVYNTISGVYKISTDADFITLVRGLYTPKNLGVLDSSILLSYMSDDIEWAIREKVIVPTNVEDKPIVMLPILNLQKDVSKFGNDNIEDRLSIIGSKQSLISGVYIRISQICDCEQNEIHDYRRIASLQYPCPSYCGSRASIGSDTLSKILDSLKYTSVSLVDIIFDSSYFDENSIDDFINDLSCHNYKYRLHFYAEDIDTALLLRDKVKKNSIQLITYIDKFTKKTTLNKLTSVDKVKRLVYEGIEETECIQSLPIYIGEIQAQSFPKKCVSEEGVIEPKLKFINVFWNMKLNSNFFGIFDITPTCDIHAHGSQHIIGNLQLDNFSWTNMVVRELQQNNSWRLTRDMTSCKCCPFRYLCPPISSYEIASNNTQICKTTL